MSILSPLIAGLAAGVYIYSFYVLTQFCKYFFLFYLLKLNLSNIYIYIVIPTILTNILQTFIDIKQQPVTQMTQAQGLAITNTVCLDS